MNKRWFFFLILIGIVSGIGYAIISQSYPIALVNWQSIAMKDFKTNYSSARLYYRRALEIYNKEQAGVLDLSETQKEFSRAVLDKLIEDILIEQELKKRFKNNELEKMVAEKIERAFKGKDIRKEAETFYGLSFEKFKENFLEPQAKSEIFASRLLLENKDFNEELKKIKKQAAVTILSPNFQWNGEGVIIN